MILGAFLYNHHVKSIRFCNIQPTGYKLAALETELYTVIFKRIAYEKVNSPNGRDNTFTLA